MKIHISTNGNPIIYGIPIIEPNKHNTTKTGIYKIESIIKFLNLSDNTISIFITSAIRKHITTNSFIMVASYKCFVYSFKNSFTFSFITSSGVCILSGTSFSKSMR